MLFHPISNTIKNSKEYLALKNNQKKTEISINANRRGKISPSHEMNHHLIGSRYGARQASKKTEASIKLMIIKNLRKKVRSRVTINAIYPIKRSLWPPGPFITWYKCFNICPFL